MAMTSGASTTFRSGGLYYAPFTLDVYVREYEYFPDTEQLDAMPSNSVTESMFDARNGFARDKVLGAWSRRWAHWGGWEMVLRNDDIRYVYMPFLGFEEEYIYASQLTAVIGLYDSLSIEDLSTAGLYFIFWVQFYD